MASKTAYREGLANSQRMLLTLWCKGQKSDDSGNFLAFPSSSLENTFMQNRMSSGDDKIFSWKDS